MTGALWAVPGIPLGVGGAIAIAGHRADRWAGPAAVSGAAASSIGTVWALAVRPAVHTEWLRVAGRPIRVGLVADGLGAAMALLVAIVCFLVFGYAVGFMRSDGSRGRFFAFMSVFCGAMLALVLAADFIVLLAAWEVVGACSYALIGFWYTDSERPRSACQAFVVTRTADLGLFLAVFAAFSLTGSFTLAPLIHSDGGTGLLPSIVAAGMIAAAAGKSAQLPFSPWLFAAMTGPTPVSALLHSATMVAAGAYLLARMHPFLVTTGWATDAIVWLGVSTALAGAVVALWQSELKPLLAASTSSQYGFVIAGVGTGAVSGSLAHLANHAAFKALLFLGAGVLLHRLGTEKLDDMRRLGRAMPRTAVMFGIGALALAAVPPLGGFFTKDEILGALRHGPSGAWAIGLVTAFVTAVYAGRAWLVPFAGRTNRFGSGGRQATDPGAHLGWPMAALAAATVAGAGLSISVGRALWHNLVGGAPTPPSSVAEAMASAAIAAAGIAAAYALHRRDKLAAFVRVPVLAPLGRQWFALPAAAEWLVVRPVLAFARALAAFDDRVVDGGVRVAGAIGRGSARLWAGVDDHVLDRIVRGSARATLGSARLWARIDDHVLDRIVGGSARATLGSAVVSRVADDRLIDGVVEAGASIVRRMGASTSRIQTGATFHYYAMAAAAVGVLVVLFAVW